MFTLEMVLLTKSKQFKWLFMVTVFISRSKNITSSTKQLVQGPGVLPPISKPNHVRIDVLAYEIGLPDSGTTLSVKLLDLRRRMTKFF